MESRDDLVAYCEVNASPFKTYFEGRKIGTFKRFFSSNEKDTFMKAKIGTSTCSERLAFVATLKNYLQLCASPSEARDILGVVNIDDGEETDGDDLSFGLEPLLPMPAPSPPPLSSPPRSLIPSPVDNSRSSVTPAGQATAFSQASAVSTDLDLASLCAQLKNSSKSIYYFNGTVKDSCVIGGKFSTINFDFEEEGWYVMGKDYRPSSFVANTSYDLVSPKSNFLKYISIIAKFIDKKLRIFFPFELPCRYAFEIASVFASKYIRLDEMYQTYKRHHTKMNKYVDVADLLQAKLKNLFKVRAVSLKHQGLWPFRPSKLQVQSTGQQVAPSSEANEHNPNAPSTSQFAGRLPSATTEINVQEAELEDNEIEVTEDQVGSASAILKSNRKRATKSATAPSKKMAGVCKTKTREQPRRILRSSLKSRAD